MKTRFFAAALLLALSGGVWAQPQAMDATSRLQSQPVDVSADFHDATNNFFFADHLASFDVQKAEGLVNWRRGCLRPRQAFNLNMLWPRYMEMLDFPGTAYDNDPDLKLKLDFVSPRTVRIRMLTTPVEPKPEASLMLAGEPGTDNSWQAEETDKYVRYTRTRGALC